MRYLFLGLVGQVFVTFDGAREGLQLVLGEQETALQLIGLAAQLLRGRLRFVCLVPDGFGIGGRLLSVFLLGLLCVAPCVLSICLGLVNGLQFGNRANLLVMHELVAHAV